jgi:uncharacterized membrane protein
LRLHGPRRCDNKLTSTLFLSRFWQEKYKPRYFLPWTFMTVFWFISPALCLIIRFYLVRENKIRAAKLGASSDEGESKALDTDEGLLRVESEDLDQTDRENLRFVYPL